MLQEIIETISNGHVPSYWINNYGVPTKGNCRIAHIENWLKKFSIEIVNPNMRNKINPSYCGGVIYLPEINYVPNIEQYYIGAFHEIIHYIGDMKHDIYFKNAWSNERQHAQEEIIAQIGALILVKKFNLKLQKETLINEYAYLKLYLKKYTLPNLKQYLFFDRDGNEYYIEDLRKCYSIALERINYIILNQDTVTYT